MQTVILFLTLVFCLDARAAITRRTLLLGAGAVTVAQAIPKGLVVDAAPTVVRSVMYYAPVPELRTEAAIYNRLEHWEAGLDAHSFHMNRFHQAELAGRVAFINGEVQMAAETPMAPTWSDAAFGDGQGRWWKGLTRLVSPRRFLEIENKAAAGGLSDPQQLSRFLAQTDFVCPQLLEEAPTTVLIQEDP